MSTEITPQVGQKTSALSAPVVLSSNQTPFADYSVTGALTAPAQTVELTSLQGVSDVMLTITGSWTGTLLLEGSANGTDYVALFAHEYGTPSYSFSSWTTNVTAARSTIAGLNKVRVRASALSAGTANVSLRASAGGNAIATVDPIDIAADSPFFAFRDAFQRQRVSSIATIFESKQLYNGEPFYWDNQQTSGSGTGSVYSSVNARTSLSVSNLTAGTRVRQTFCWWNYQPGKSQLAMMTFTLGAGATGITRRVGLFETNNGFFLEQAASVLSVNIRTQSDAGNQSIAQSAWNIDKMDGTGPSRITLDVTKAQILVIDFQWLGVGAVRFGFFVDGVTYYVHQFRNANRFTSVYMSTPNLPIRFEISNSGAGPSASFDTMCATIISEGGIANNGQQHSIDRGATGLVMVAATLHPLILLQLQSGRQGAASAFLTVRLQALGTGGRDFLWQLLVNPTLGGAALPAYVPVPNSSLQAITNTVGPAGPTVTAGTGTVLASGYFNQDLNVGLADVVDYQLGTTIAGVSDTLVLAVQQITGATETVVGSIGFSEFN